MQHDNTVFIVDPDEAIGGEVAELLGMYDVCVRAYPNAEDFLGNRPAENAGTSSLLVAAKLPEMSGMALVQRLRTDGFNEPIIVLIGSANRELRHQALEIGATVVIEKPVAQAFLLARLSELQAGTAPDTAPAGLTLHDGTLVTFRIMHPEDAAIEQQFVRDLSPRSKHQRFFSMFAELPAAMLEQFTHPEYPRTYALIATVREAERERQIAVVRYEPTAVVGVVEFAIVVADEWQRLGLASEMLRGLTAVACVAGMQRLEAPVLRQNHRMLAMVKSLGFATSPCEEDSTVVRVSKDLRHPRSRPSVDRPGGPASRDINSSHGIR